MFNIITAFAAYLSANAKTDRGATAVEYGLMVALIAVLIIAAVTALSTAISGTFNSAAAAI